MIDLVKLNDRTKRVMDAMFSYIDANDVTFYVYKAKDFPFMKAVCEEIVEDINTISKTKAKQIVYFKGYKRNNALVMLTLLLNNRDINDITYQYENMNNFVKTNYTNIEVFQIILNCHYTTHRQFMSALRNSIKAYLTDKNDNREKGADSLG